MPFIDLHIHSSFSDGTEKPAAIVTTLKELGFSALSITDHDTVDGQAEANKIASKLGIEYVPGVEFSSSYEGIRIHILGYFIDYENQNLINTTQRLIEERNKRALKILEKLKSLGIYLELEDVLVKVTNYNIGRLHIAKAMVDRGWVKGVRAAFDLYLGYGKPAYVPKWTPTPSEIIELYHSSGGLAVLAHPGVIGDDRLIPRLVEWGLDGIEAFYPEHTPEQVERYNIFCQKHGLVATGGSDSHGKVEGKPMLGVYRYPYEILEEMKQRLSLLKRC